MLKQNLIASLVALVCLGSVACGARATGPPDGSHLELSWELLHHFPERETFRSRLSLTNRGEVGVEPHEWSLYFNFARPIILESAPLEVRLEHLNGDLYRLIPSELFPVLQTGESISIEFESRHWISNLSQAPSGFYLVFEDTAETPQAIETVRLGAIQAREQLKRSERDRVEMPDPETRYRGNARIELLALASVPLIVPSPVRLRSGPGSVRLDKTVQIGYQPELEAEARYLAVVLEGIFGEAVKAIEGSGRGANRISLEAGSLTVAGRSREAYRIVAEPARGILIEGSDPTGVFYGIQSLRALIPVESYSAPAVQLTIPEVHLEDAPRFPYRGMHLDVARNFKSVSSVKRLLELMSFYKLNRFHFHLTDDEGWRLEVADLPELTEVGGRRGHTRDERDHLIPSLGSGPDPDPAISPGSGFYTRKEFIEILRFARKRHIEVIPEIDVPGHARAAIRAMDARHARLTSEGLQEEALQFLLQDPEDDSQYQSVQMWNDNAVDVCRESTYSFLEVVVNDLIALYREAGAPLTAVHIGGDEVPEGVWEGSPSCRRLLQDPASGLRSKEALFSYFLSRVNRMLSQRGLITAGWEEVALVPAAEGSHKVPNAEFTGRGFRVHAWNSVWGWGGEENGYRLANAGFPVVLSNASNLYFDLAYDRDPEEMGYDWAGFVDTHRVWEFNPYDLYQGGRSDVLGNPLGTDAYRDSVRLTAEGRRNILGLQGQLWGETARSGDDMEYLAFPRLIALSERAWAQEPSWMRLARGEVREEAALKDWELFANLVGQRELPRLDFLEGGIRYRLPPPGAVIEGGLLKANSEFPGMQIRLTRDGSEPHTGSELYTGPVLAEGLIRLKTFDSRGRGSRTSVVGN